jgi:hypothetical protein
MKVSWARDWSALGYKARAAELRAEASRFRELATPPPPD